MSEGRPHGFECTCTQRPCIACGGDSYCAEYWTQERQLAMLSKGIISPPTFRNICALQQPSAFTQVEQGLIHLLKDALNSQGGNFHAALSGDLDHFHASPEDLTWGCGWRNMQMLSSHLLCRSEGLSQALYGGCGYTLDIPSLQAWLECAWALGFDREGAEQLSSQIQGTQKWVGASEAAAVLRQFGVRAHIVDFRSAYQDKVDHTCLLDWVWHYFTGETPLMVQQGLGRGAFEECRVGGVSLTGKPPLYLQQYGHSCTVVGAERHFGADGRSVGMYLLVLDPVTCSGKLVRALLSGNGWQSLIKRSACWLQQPDYQVLHCLDGFASGQELADLKIMRSYEGYGFK